MKLNFIVSLSTILISLHGFGDTKFPKGISFDIGGGYGESTVQNPDNTQAVYTVLAVTARTRIPLFQRPAFATELLGGIKYLDLKNNANVASQKEVANLIGLGPGLIFRFYKFFIGTDYNLMFARHYAIGNTSNEISYMMSTLTYYGGLQLPFQNLVVSVSYSASTGKIPRSKSRLSTDSKYEENIYWVNLIYYTDSSIEKFLKYLF